MHYVCFAVICAHIMTLPPLPKQRRKRNVRLYTRTLPSRFCRRKRESSLNLILRQFALPWPFKSSVFNTFEHLWYWLFKHVCQRQPPTQTLDELRQMLQQEWRTIPKKQCEKFYESMPRRCRAVLAARGGHTRY
jgi:hypothetical protein